MENERASEPRSSTSGIGGSPAITLQDREDDVDASRPKSSSGGINVDDFDGSDSSRSLSSARSAAPTDLVASAAAAESAVPLKLGRTGGVGESSDARPLSGKEGHAGNNEAADDFANGASFRKFGDGALGGGISGVPTTKATSHQNNDGEFATRGRFRRSRGVVPVESLQESRERFWTGVKLAQAGPVELPSETRESLVARAKPTRQKSKLLPTLTGSNRVTMATVRAAIKLKQKANVIQAKSVLNWSILDPRSPRMRSWKNWMFVNIMYTVLVVPWRISFNLPAQAFGLTLSAIANVSFVIDTVLHFFTAVETESGLVTDHVVILRRYLSSWFIIDFVTCLPYTTLLRDSIPASMTVLTPLRGLRLLSLLKVAKVYAMHYEVSPVAMSIGKTLVTVILAAHLLSCLWFWMNCFEALDALEPKSWTQCGLPKSAASQYLSSFYFIIYTMMTVGYGDQHADPSSKKGLFLSLIIQLTGATLFGFIIAATRRIVQFIAPIQKVTITNLQKISEYAIDRRLPDGVTSRIKRHFRYFYFKTSVFDEQVVMAHVPWHVSQEVMATTHRVALAATSLLQDQDFSPAVLMRLARAMKPMELDSNQEAARQGDIVLQVYFVIKGRIEAYVYEGDGGQLPPAGEGARHSLREASYLGVWGPGSIWGLNNVLLGGFSEASFVAASQTDLLWIDQVDLIAVIDDHDEIRSCLEKTANIEQQALQEAAGSATITKEGLKLKQISLTDFKASDLKQQLKHTDIHNLCTMASTAQQAASTAKRRSSQGGGGPGGGMQGMVQDFQQMAAFGGMGVKGTVESIVASLKGAWKGRAKSRMQMRLVRTWRAGSPGFGEVLDGTGKAVKGVTETEETPEELNHRLIVLPDQRTKLQWDAGISMVCVLVAVLTPYRMAFAPIDAKRWLAFDAMVDICFVIDILLKFRTAYVGNAANNVIVYITVPAMIVKNYLRGWMIFDLASTVPGYLFADSDRMFRSLVVLKLLRVGRVPALGEQLLRLSEQDSISNDGPATSRKGWLRGMHIDVPRWCVDVAQILIVILYASHIFGCLWWVTSRYDERRSWWEVDGLDIEDARSTYIASIYWAAATITTVGYGDLVPTNDLERAIACLTMVCGTTMFSYVIGSVSTLVMNPTGGNVRRNLELMNVENYLEEQKVGAHLGSSVRAHMVFIMGARSAWNEEHILSRLPPNIQHTVLEHVHRDAIEVIPILKGRPLGFVCAILRNLRPQQYAQGEIVYKNVHMSQGVYFVTKGTAVASVKNDARRESSSKQAVEDKVVGVVSSGRVFGYTRFLASFLEDDLTVKALSLLHVYLLSNNTIRHLLYYHPFLAEELRLSLEKVVFEQASEEISMEKKKRAMKRTKPGEENSSSRPPAGVPLEQDHDQSQTSALTSYLRRESKTPVSRPSKLPFKRAKSRKNAPQEKTDAAENGLEMTPVGTEKQRTTQGWNLFNEKEGVEESESSTNESDHSGSLSAPGLSGLFVAQLTWGAGNAGWDAALREGVGEEEEEGGGGGGGNAADIREHPIVAAAAAAAAAAASADLEVVTEAGGPGSGGARSHEQQQGGDGDVGRRTIDVELSASQRHPVADGASTGLAEDDDAAHREPPSDAALELREESILDDWDEDSPRR